jgi:glucokinase
LDLLATIMAQEAGNAGTRSMATGGVWLAGGMPPRLLSRLRRPATIAAFHRSRTLAAVLARIPLGVVRNDHCAVLGAAAVAREAAAEL